jgi:exopolysaccharide production protein ExoQ
MDSDPQLTETTIFSEHGKGRGPALLVGVFLGFHLIVNVLAVWLLGATPQAGTMFDLILNYLVLIAVAFACLGDAPFGGGFLRSAPSRWALLFLVFSGCSLVWTVAVSVPAAVVFWCAMAADVGTVVLLLLCQPAELVIASLFRGYVYGASAVAIIAWILPTTKDNRLGYEGLMGTNAIGFLCAFAFFLAQYLVLVRRERHTLSMILLGVTLLRSLSKTTIIAFLLSQAFLLAASRSIPRRTKILVTIGAILTVLVFSSLLLSYLEDYATSNAEGYSEAESLSGRFGIWALMGAEAIERPWFGHGFHSVWNVIPPFGRDHFEIRHAHNELLQQFYAYGAVGVVVFFGIYISFFRQIRRQPRGILRTFLFSFLIFLLIRGVADTEVFDLSLPLWMIIPLSALMGAGYLSRTPPGTRDATKPASIAPELFGGVVKEDGNSST